MNKEESIQQIETLIEAWQLDEADLNQTDINAMQALLKENQELKEKYENAVVDYETTMTEKNELKKQVEDLFSENRNLRKKLEKCMTFEDYKYTLNKKIKLETQQKEFIKYLEDEIKVYKNDIQNFSKDYNVYFSLINDLRVSKAKIKDILQKYKEIIGDDK